MNNDAVLIEFIHYNNWANQALLRACEGLTPEQLSAGAPGTYGPLNRTLEHLVDSEAFYYRLLTGEPLTPPFEWEDGPGVADIRAYDEQVGQALLRAAGQVSPDAVVHQRWQGGETSYKALALFIQIVNHGIEHRTNVTTILAALGLPAPEVDGWSYQWANRDRLGAD